MAITSTQPTTEFTYREITLQDRLREVAREVGDKPALLMGDRSVSFREIDQKRRLVAEDRKSTRLNSSHSQISYAVFCLKKKTPLVSTTASARDRLRGGSLSRPAGRRPSRVSSGVTRTKLKSRARERCLKPSSTTWRLGP